MVTSVNDSFLLGYTCRTANYSISTEKVAILQYFGAASNTCHVSINYNLNDDISSSETHFIPTKNGRNAIPGLPKRVRRIRYSLHKDSSKKKVFQELWNFKFYCVHHVISLLQLKSVNTVLLQLKPTNQTNGKGKKAGLVRYCPEQQSV